MAKSRAKHPVPQVGDAFAVPLEGGRFTVSRVLAVHDGKMLVANADWIGREVPDPGNPALQSIMRLTHHRWAGKLCAVWVLDSPSQEFIYIGNIPLGAEAESVQERAIGGWVFLQNQAHEQWIWDHPEDTPPPQPPPPPPAGRFVLHRFNGDEVYHLESAVIKAYESELGATLWFEVRADSKNAQWCEDTAEMRRSPNATVGIELADLDADELVGREFTIAGTITDEEDSCMSLLYYCEHEPLRNNFIKVESRAGDRFRLKWTATARDVNYYDDSKPVMRVEIEGEFLFKNVDMWVND
jgi:hypothetical protein